MHIPTRWRKILKDMRRNKTRTALVVLSIAVGVAAVGMVLNSWNILIRDLYTAFGQTNPHSVYIYVTPFDESLANAVEDMREVEAVTARRTLAVQVMSPASGKWEDMSLNAVPDYEDIDVDRYFPEEGKSIPGLREIVLERKSARDLNVEIGDTLTIEIGDEEHYDLRVSGTVHDLHAIPPVFRGETLGYVSNETLQWMGQRIYYNRLDVVPVSGRKDISHVNTLVAEIRDRVVEPAGYTVRSAEFSPFGAGPGEFWAERNIDGLSVVFQSMGVMCLLLSAGLVINTISAILTQQVREIGMMRSIGASQAQIARLYLANVLVFGVVALVLAFPLALLGSWGIAAFIASLINFDITDIRLAPHVVAIVSALSLVMPLLAALVPILSGTRITTYDAIYQHGITSEGKRGAVEEMLNRLKGIARPVLFGLRNTVRRKVRLVLTLAVLTLAGAMFIAVWTTRDSLNYQIQQIARYIAYDAVIGLPDGTQRQTAEREALRIPEVSIAEGWLNGSTRIIHPDGSEGEDIQIRAPVQDSQTIKPLMVAGRWLEPDDQAQIVINEDLLDEEPDIGVGSVVTLKIGSLERPYEVVGIASRHMSSPVVYMTYDYYAKLTGRHNQADQIRVRISPDRFGSNAQQQAVANALERRFEDAGLGSGIAGTRNSHIDRLSNAFDLVLIFLMIMAGLLAVVGGLGLAGTMSMNVLERTREIGVLRAVGASNGGVVQVVVVEGLTVGLVSWILGLILSVPLGMVLSDAVGMAVFNTTLRYQHSVVGSVAWLVLALLIGTAASLAPAHRASHLTVREVLAYE
jgi:putative ABC transport system permease protein